MGFRRSRREDENNAKKHPKRNCNYVDFPVTTGAIQKSAKRIPFTPPLRCWESAGVHFNHHLESKKLVFLNGADFFLISALWAVVVIVMMCDRRRLEAGGRIDKAFWLFGLVASVIA